ncbi:MAG: autotransporter domain-containing protein [Candidatus Thiodiazotropha sp.]
MLPLEYVASGLKKNLRLLRLLLLPPLLAGSADVLALLNYSPAGIDFGEVDAGSSSTQQSVLLTNTSDSYFVTIYSITTQGDFVADSACGTSLGPNQHCQIMVSFAPQSTGAQTGQLLISANDPALDPPPIVPMQLVNLNVSLSGIGTGLDGALATDVSAVDFGSVSVNATSQAESITLSNNGSAPVTLGAISTDAPFGNSHDCPDILAAAATCTIQVSASPSIAGDQYGDLLITGTSNSGALEQRVALNVNATPLATSVSPELLSFPQTDAGSSSDPQAVTLSNQSDVAIAINSITIEGDFAQSNDCGTLLPAGGQCAISVSFTPQAPGNLTGELIIASDATTSRVSLSGAGAISVDYVANLLLPYVGDDPNAVSTSEIIAAACLSGDISPRMQEDCNAVVAAAYEGVSGTGSALLQITPESATKANRTARQGGETQSRNLGTRINALRAGVRGLSFQGLDLKIYDQNLPIGKLATAYQRQLRGAGAGADNALLENRFGIFLTGDITTGSKDKTDVESGLDFDTYGITLGADYRFTNQFILGGAVGYIDTNTTLDDGMGDLDTTGYSVSLYGTYYGKQQYFFDFSLSYGSNNFAQRRVLQYELEGLASVDQEMKSDYDGSMFSLFLGSGYDFQSGPWTFGPRADLEYIKSEVDGFSETASDPNASGGGWVTQVDATDQNWLTLNFGGKLSYTLSTSWGVLIPYTRLDWLHEFKDDAQVINAYFADDPSGSAIRIETDNPDRDYLRLRLGASAQLRQGMVLFFDYGTLMAHSNWSSNTINIGLRMEL